jgi:hypothetical protein
VPTTAGNGTSVIHRERMGLHVHDRVYSVQELNIDVLMITACSIHFPASEFFAIINLILLYLNCFKLERVLYHQDALKIQWHCILIVCSLCENRDPPSRRF